MMSVYQNFELTENNHLTYYFNKSNIFRTSYKDIASMEVKIAATDLNFLQTLLKTSKSLSSKHKKFHLFLSGGLDSEVAFRIFKLNNISVLPVILVFKNELNAEDVFYAQKLCKEFNTSPIIFDIDIFNFFESGRWIDAGKAYQCYTFYQQMLLNVAKYLAEPLITIDEIELVNKKSKWKFIKKEDQDGCWHRFVDATGIPAYNNFYTYNPQTIYSFLQNTTVKKLVKNEIYGKLSWTSSKHQIYSELTNFSLEPRKKLGGVEKISNIWDYVENYSQLFLNNTPVTFEIDIENVYQADHERFICQI